MRRAWCLIALLAGTPACAQIRAVALLPPSRTVGLLVGDTLAGTADITVGPDTRLDPTSLPAAGPIAPSIDITGSKAAVARVGEGRRYTIRVTYQTFTSPDHVTNVEIPAYPLAFWQSGHRLTVSVPGFSFTASPMRDALQTTLDASALRPDHPPAWIDTAAPARMIAAGGAIAVLASCALAAITGGLPWPRRGPRPFAAALQAITRQRSATTARAAFLLLHRAFDETAGTRVFAEDLDAFFARHPHFTALRAEIETFFAASRSVFFGAPSSASPAPPERLARGLMRAERRR
jgi:mxaA protein